MRPRDYWINGFSGIWGMSVIDNGSKHHFWGVGVTNPDPSRFKGD